MEIFPLGRASELINSFHFIHVSADASGDDTTHSDPAPSDCTHALHELPEAQRRTGIIMDTRPICKSWHLYAVWVCIWHWKQVNIAQTSTWRNVGGGQYPLLITSNN